MVNFFSYFRDRIKIPFENFPHLVVNSKVSIKSSQTTKYFYFISDVLIKVKLARIA